MNVVKKIISNKNLINNIRLRAVVISVLCTLLVLLICNFGFLEYLENKSYDRRMNNSELFFNPADEIVFIAVDQESLDWCYENKGWSWPWPREAYGNIVEFLSAGNVNSIMFDVFYTEPSIYGDNDDKLFAEAQKKSGNVINTVFLQDSKKALFPIDSIKNSSAMLANIRSTMDEDDVIRRYKLYETIEGKEYPSLGIAPLVLESRKNNNEFKMPVLRKDGTVKLRFQKSVEDYFPYKAYEIIESYDNWKENKESFLVPTDFSDKYVFFALYAPGLFDICSTPVSQVYPGVGVHIAALDNYIQNNYIYDVPDFVNYIWFFLVSIMATFFVVFCENRKTKSHIILFLYLSFILGAILTFEIPFVFFIFGIYMEQVGPFINYLISFFVMFGVIYMIEGKQKRFIKAAFSQCLSKDVVNNIINDPSSFTLGGKKFQMSAIFTDIEKFSSISELLTASELGKLLNYYLTRMSDIIIKEKGTIDKYEGDAIVAMVGAPVSMEDHAIRACRAALKMKKEENLMNSQIKALVKNDSLIEASKAGIDEELFNAFKILINNKKQFFTRIGINSGEMIAGYFGSTLKKNYTIMGNNVNLASRLEGVNKQYSTGGILISQFTKELTEKSGKKEFIVRRLDKVQVVNVNTPIQLYELLEEADKGAGITFNGCSLISYVEQWEKAIDLFNGKKYKEALELFTFLSRKNIEDKVAEYYVNLLEKFFTNGKYPSEADGIGVSYNKELGVFKLLQK